MKTFANQGDDGRLVSFEIRSLWSRRVAWRAIRSIPDVRIVRPLKAFALENQDVFCVFQVGDVVLEIEEPWGDSSRFRIAERHARPSPELERVMAHFRAFRPWLSLLGR